MLSTDIFQLFASIRLVAFYRQMRYDEKNGGAGNDKETDTFMRIAGKNITTIVSDFDGTILKDGAWEAPKEFYEVINEAMRQGHMFVAASGRQYPNMYAMLHTLEQEIVYICENGCLVMYQGEVIHKETIEESLAQELLADLQVQSDAEITISGEKTCYMVPNDPAFAEIMEHTVHYHVTVLEDFAQIKEAPLKLAICFPKGIPEETKAWFIEKYGDRLQVVEAGNNFIDFNPLGSGKGTALKMVAERFGFALEECVAFGDSENDISMFRVAGLSFAMEGAKEHVKACARYTCDSVEDVVWFGMEYEKDFAEWVGALAKSAEKSGEEAAAFWERIRKDEELLEELEYYSMHKSFLCKHKVAGYTVTDILVWQVDHFKAYLDRHEEVNRYHQGKLLYNAFDILLQMRENPEPFINKLQGETGTDFVGKYH